MALSTLAHQALEAGEAEKAVAMIERAVYVVAKGRIGKAGFEYLGSLIGQARFLQEVSHVSRPDWSMCCQPCVDCWDSNLLVIVTSMARIFPQS